MGAVSIILLPSLPGGFTVEGWLGLQIFGFRLKLRVLGFLVVRVQIHCSLVRRLSIILLPNLPRKLQLRLKPSFHSRVKRRASSSSLARTSCHMHAWVSYELSRKTA